MSPTVVALVGPRHVELVDEPGRRLSHDEVRIRTLLSGVSAGTEMAFYRGTNPYLAKRWDPTSRLFEFSPAHTAEYRSPRGATRRSARSSNRCEG